MSENNLDETQNLLRNFQKIMMKKATTVRGQWNSITCLENISQAQLARRMNVLGLKASNVDVAQLFYYLGIKKNSLGFNDFITLMETDPSSLSPKSRRIPQLKGFEHETLHAYENDYNLYCRRTAGFTPTFQTRNTLVQKNSKKITRPLTESKSPRKKKNSIKTSSYSPDTNDGDEDQYISTDHHNNSNALEGNVTFTYEPCKSILERSLPRDLSSKKTRETTLGSFSNTAIQRQYYDGVENSETLNSDTGMSIKELVTKISDIAYISCSKSRACYYKWRDPHHDELDASDLRNGLKRDYNFEISQSDAQKVIDRYGGPMNLSTFTIMLHDGSHFNPNKSFGYDDI